MKPEQTPKETFKQALISILIGAVISFLTVLFQGFLDLLQGVPAEIPGVMAGIGKYLHSWKSHLNV